MGDFCVGRLCLLHGIILGPSCYLCQWLVYIKLDPPSMFSHEMKRGGEEASVQHNLALLMADDGASGKVIFLGSEK